VILRCNSDGDLYTLPSSSPAPAHALLAASSTTWHHHLGHPAPAALDSLRKKNFISCNKVERSICHSCQLGKHTRLPFSLSKSHTVASFELLHCDVWTSPVHSISDFSYYLVILDDYTHHCWTFPLKRKSNVHQHMVEFIAYANTQFGLPVKCFQADNGTEFVNNATASFLAARDILLRLSCPYTSPQNSKAERVLRTLNNSVRTLMLHASMPPSYWVEALAAATYLLNQRPSSSIGDKVPYVRLHGKPPQYDHLRVFGCLCYPNLHATSAHKLAARHKARWVVRGFSQQHGVDNDETFSPVVKPATIRTVLNIASSHQWPIHQLDVKNAFLHGYLNETVYCQRPPGFIDPSRPDHVCLLQRSLYGLKQAPHVWYQRFATYLQQLGFVPSVTDTSLFVYNTGGQTAYLLLYVDDIVLTASSTDLLHSIIQRLHSEFAMTDLGALHHFLGISVTRSSDGLFLSQRQYAMDVLQRAGMSDCHPSLTPVDSKSKLSATNGPPVDDASGYRSIAGALQWLTLTHPDLAYAVQQVCLFMQ
jgi:transposase InsO family protein